MGLCGWLGMERCHPLPHTTISRSRAGVGHGHRCPSVGCTGAAQLVRRVGWGKLAGGGSGH